MLALLNGMTQVPNQLFARDNRSLDMRYSVTRSANTGSFSSGSSGTESSKAIQNGRETIGASSGAQA
jgi:hypothetical protein